MLLGLGPHQVDVALRAAQFQRIGRIAAEIQQRPAVLLIGLCRVGGSPRNLVDLAVVFDVVARPGLAQDLHHLVAALVAIGAVGHLAGEVAN
jgi:hypothetical protein